MKLRLPNKLVAAIMAAASPVLLQTLSTATLAAATVTVVSQARADMVNAVWEFDGSLSPTTTISTVEYQYEGGDATYADSCLSDSSYFGGYHLDKGLGQALTFSDGTYLKLKNNAYWANGDGALQVKADGTAKNSYTIMAWVKFDSLSGELPIFGTGDGNGSGVAFGLQDGQVDLLTKGVSHNKIGNNVTLAAGEWVNLAVTYDKDTNTANAYVNGVLWGTKTGMATFKGPGGACSYIGAASPDGAQDNFTGQIAEFQILNTALDQAGILSAAHLVANGEAKSYRWNAVEGDSNHWTGNSVWTRSQAGDKETFADVSDATFGADSSLLKNVAITTAAAASRNVTLEESANYTFTLSNAATLSMQRLSLNAETSLLLSKEENATGFYKIASLSGTGKLMVKANTILSGAGTDFTGTLEVQEGGVLTAGHNNAFGAVGHTVTVDRGGVVDINGYEGTGDGYSLTLNGGTLTNSGSSLDGGHRQMFTNILLKADSTICADRNHDFGLIASNYIKTTLTIGDYTLTKTGAGTYRIYNATVTGAGSLRVENGILDFWKDGTLASNIELAGGNLNGTIVLGNNVTIKGTNESSVINAGITLGGNTLTLNGTADIKVNGSISDAGSVIKNDANSVILQGGAGYAATNGLTLEIKAGSVKADSGWTGTIGCAVNIADGAVLDLSAVNADAGNNRVLTLMANAEGEGLIKAKSAWGWTPEGDVTTRTNFQLTGSLYLGVPNSAGGRTLTIGSGTTTTVTEDAHMEGNGTLKVQGVLDTARVVLGHSEATGSAGYFVVDGDGSKMIANSVLAGCTEAKSPTNNSTLTVQNGGTLQIKGGQMFTAGHVESITFAVNGGTLLAEGNDWSVNHDSSLNNATLATVGEDDTLTVGGADYTTTLSGTLTKTGAGAARLEGTMDGSVTTLSVEGGNLELGTGAHVKVNTALSIAESARLSVGDGAALTLNNINAALNQSRIYGTGTLTMNISSGYTDNGRTVDLRNFEGDIYVARTGSSDTRILMSDGTNQSYFNANATLHMGAGTDLVFSSAAEKVLESSVIFADSSTIFANAGANGKISGAVSVQSDKTLTKQGGGTLKLTGDLTDFNGGLNVAAGTLVVDGTTLNLKNGATVSGSLQVSGGSLSISGNVNNSLSGTLAMISPDSEINVLSGTQKFNTLDLSNSNAAGGTMTVETGAHVVANNVWVGSNSTIQLKENAEIKTDNVSIIGMKDNATLTNNIQSTSQQEDKYTSNKTTFEITNGQMTYLAGSAKTIANKLVSSKVVNNSSNASVLTVSNDDNTLVGIEAQKGNILIQNAASSKDSLKSIKAEGGDVTLQNLTAQTGLSLNELVIGNSKTVSALTDGSNAVNAQERNVAAISIAADGKLTAGVGATLNANLTMQSGSTLDVQQGGLSLGCSLTLNNGEDFVLHGATVTDGKLENYILYTGVDSFVLNGATITDMGWYDAKDVQLDRNIISSIIADGESLDLVNHSYVFGFWNGTVSLAESTVPEPTTATLSLLALAGLAARRRRK